MNLLTDFSKDKLSGKDLREIRGILRISQDRLYKLLDISLSTVCQWEQERRGISGENQIKLLTMVNGILEHNKEQEMI